VNNQVIAKLDNGRFNPKDLAKDGRTIVPLKNLLSDEYKKRNAVFSEEGAEAKDLPPGRVIIQSDKTLEFATVKFVLHTAAVAHYNDYEFVVENQDE
jgi:hypothetical protein